MPRNKSLSCIQKTAGFPDWPHSLSRIYGSFLSFFVVMMLSFCFSLLCLPLFALPLAGARLLGGNAGLQAPCSPFSSGPQSFPIRRSHWSRGRALMNSSEADRQSASPQTFALGSLIALSECKDWLFSQASLYVITHITQIFFRRFFQVIYLSF